MRKITDKQIARLYLAGRGKVLTFPSLVRSNAKKYLIFFVVIAMALLATGLFPMWAVFFLVLGMMSGVLLRDVGWTRSMASMSQFFEKVTDWDKVQAFADGD